MTVLIAYFISPRWPSHQVMNILTFFTNSSNKKISFESNFQIDNLAFAFCDWEQSIPRKWLIPEMITNRECGRTPCCFLYVGLTGTSLNYSLYLPKNRPPAAKSSLSLTSNLVDLSNTVAL